MIGGGAGEGLDVSFGFGNRDTRLTPVTSLRCLYYKLESYFARFSGVSDVAFEQVILC